jgi:hypothetical protein
MSQVGLLKKWPAWVMQMIIPPKNIAHVVPCKSQLAAGTLAML